MATLSREAFARRLRRLDDADLAAFVADCWAARGWTTAVADGVVHATDHPERPDRRLGVGPESDAPTVVAPDGPPAAGRPALDAADLHGLCAYVLERETADRLCSEYLGVTVTDGVGPTVADRVARAVPGRRTVEAAALLAVVAGGLLLLLPGGPSLPGLGESAAAAPATPAPGDDPGAAPLTPMDTPGGSDAPGDSPTVGADPPIPGLSAAGVTDPGRLADAHAEAVTGQSYRLTLSHREWVGDEVAGGAREVVHVAGPHVYATSVERWGRLGTAPAVVQGTEAYADGASRYERVVTAEGVDVRRTAVARSASGEGYHADRVERYLQWFLDAEETRVTRVPAEGRPASVDDADLGPLYRVTGVGTDFGGAEEYEVTAVVTETGFVRQVRVSYAVPDTDARVSVGLTYDDVGETVVRPPAWAPNGTTFQGANGTTGAEGTTSDDGWDDGEPGGGTVDTGDRARIDGLSTAVRAGVAMNATTPRPARRTDAPGVETPALGVARP